MNNKMNLILMTLFLFMGDICAQINTFKVNQNGIGVYELRCQALSDNFLACYAHTLSFTTKSGKESQWRKTNLDDGYFYLDCLSEIEEKQRLRATSYLGVNLTTSGIEGMNNDTRWKIVPSSEKDWCFLEHKTSGRYLCFDGNAFVLTENKEERANILWKLELVSFDLKSLQSPILLMGDDKTAFRDPAVIYENGKFYMFYSYVLTEENENIYWYVAMSQSEDLVNWSFPKIITEKNQSKNFASPGDIIRYKDEWVLCMQTYVMPGYTRRDPLRFGNEDCRIWITRSKNLENWSEPEMLYVRGPGVDPGEMIDSYLVEDKDEKGKWWCFYKGRLDMNHKRKGAVYSYSYDLKNWTYVGGIQAGENVCVWTQNDEYYLMHSPEIGMGLLKSQDLRKWEVVFENEVLGQKNWPWANQRVTAGFVLDMRDNPAIGKYLLFFHGQGPAPKTTEIINSGCDLGIAWSDDLINWEWPGKTLILNQEKHE